MGNGSLLGVPISDYIMVVFVLAGVFVTTKTAIGTQIYGLGGNEQVLKNAGIDTAKIKLFVFSMSGFCAAAAGVLLAAQLDTAHPTQGEPYQLDAIAACIIGGVSMSGGEGKVILSMVGALVIGSIRNILNLLSVNSFYQNILVGVIIIAVVAVSMMTPRAPREQNRAVRSRRSRRAEGIERRRTMQQQQTAGKPGVVRQSAWTRFVKDHGSILMFLILFVLASVFVKNFFAVRNIFTVIKQAAVPLVACMGLMLILTTGGIDLSLGYTLGLCSCSWA